MKHNVGGKEQTVRFMIASAGIMMGLFAKRGWLKALGFSIGGSQLVTAITRHSLANRVVGEITDKVRKIA